MHEISNAKITKATLGYDDHGILTAWIMLEYDSGGQGFGGYRLDTYDKELQKSMPHWSCGAFVQELLKAVGVNSWEDLVGKPCRVSHNWNEVDGIGNYIKNEWFYPKEYFQGMKEVLRSKGESH